MDPVRVRFDSAPSARTRQRQTEQPGSRVQSSASPGDSKVELRTDRQCRQHDCAHDNVQHCKLVLGRSPKIQCASCELRRGAKHLPHLPNDAFAAFHHAKSSRDAPHVAVYVLQSVWLEGDHIHAAQHSADAVLCCDCDQKVHGILLL